jgi:dUTP pyrophosphatase
MEFKVKILDARLMDKPMCPSTPGSAGLDLRASISDPIVLDVGQQRNIPVGFALDIGTPEIAALILPRSGLSTKHGLVLGNTVGLVDSDYQGEIMVCLRNDGIEAYTIRPLERIAQMVMISVHPFRAKFVDEFEPTERGAGGFGSTGS